MQRKELLIEIIGLYFVISTRLCWRAYINQTKKVLQNDI